MTSKKWIGYFLIAELLIIFIIFGVVYIVDPYVHYKLPSEHFSYIFDRETQRYVNDGITRLYDYDAIITGTSMTECFKTSEFDALFGTESIKVPYAGAKYDEITNNLSRGFSTHKNIKYVMRSLDYFALIDTPVHDRSQDSSFPTYLYDNNLCNDFRYVFGKKMFAHSAKNIAKSVLFGEKGGVTSFDDYCNWSETFTYGKDAVLLDRKGFDKPIRQNDFSEAERKLITENINENLISMAKDHPNTTFIVFLPPFSIVKWGELYESGDIEKTISAQKYAVQMLLTEPNIEVFAFDDCYWLTTDLDNYREKEHFGGWINSFILESVYTKEHLIEESNVNVYFDSIRDYYLTYEYDNVFN